MGTNQIKLFEDLLTIDDPQNVAENLDKVQSLIVCNCLEVYGMIPDLHQTLQMLKVFFLDLEKLRKENN